MSSSSARPALSIVVGSNGAAGSVEACLEALESQVDGVAEVIVCEPSASADVVWVAFPAEIVCELSVVDPSLNVTVPVGVPAFGGTTVAVKVTD